MAVETLFTSELAQVVLVFLLVFVATFAILQKARIFGEEKKQIDALVALFMGLLVTSFGYAVNLISNLIPFMAVVLVILLVFMILYGAVFKEDTFDLAPWMKYAIGILVFIALTIAVLVYTGSWDYLKGLFASDGGSSILTNVIFAVAIIAVIAAVLGGAGGGNKSEKKD